MNIIEAYYTRLSFTGLVETLVGESDRSDFDGCESHFDLPDVTFWLDCW